MKDSKPGSVKDSDDPPLHEDMYEMLLKPAKVGEVFRLPDVPGRLPVAEAAKYRMPCPDCMKSHSCGKKLDACNYPDACRCRGPVHPRCWCQTTGMRQGSLL